MKAMCMIQAYPLSGSRIAVVLEGIILIFSFSFMEVYNFGAQVEMGTVGQVL
jgi:hypothetical protein